MEAPVKSREREHTSTTTVSAYAPLTLWCSLDPVVVYFASGLSAFRRILDIEHSKEKKRLQLDQVKIARFMVNGTEEGVENIMKNVNKGLVEITVASRKRPRVIMRIDRISKRQEQEDEFISPTPSSPKSHKLPMDNPFIEEEVEDYPIIINDIPDESSFKDEDSIDDLKIREINVSRLFRQ
ncbi:8630_t:CDS:2 [Funneliformis caledonium]|uniref:8630_t:CDS:1 n=1 Tax=Funneliformis caledonium TaxID=1117310 RepID=A0A9N9BUK4_9GLOM|nr:8630_t:CDS:2 [Funneliformis caledonium]